MTWGLQDILQVQVLWSVPSRVPSVGSFKALDVGGGSVHQFAQAAFRAFFVVRASVTRHSRRELDLQVSFCQGWGRMSGR